MSHLSSCRTTVRLPVRIRFPQRNHIYSMIYLMIEWFSWIDWSSNDTWHISNSCSRTQSGNVLRGKINCLIGATTQKRESYPTQEETTKWTTPLTIVRILYPGLWLSWRLRSWKMMLIYSWYHVTLEVKGIYIKIAFITVLSIYCSRILYGTELMILTT